MAKKQRKPDTVSLSLRLPKSLIAKVDRIAESAGTDRNTVLCVIAALEVTGYLSPSAGEKP